MIEGALLVEVDSPWLREEVPNPREIGEVWMSWGIGSSSQVVYWIPVLNFGLDLLVVHDGQVMSWWEVMEALEERPVEKGDHPEGSSKHGTPGVPCDEERKGKVL